MKTLKLKNLLFGLMAVLAVAILMTSCEQDPLENITEATLQEANTEQKRTDIQFDEVQQSEDYIEGQFYVKLKDDYNKNFKSTTSRDVDLAQLPFLNNLKSKHDFDVKSTFYFAKSPKLNRTLRVYLDDAKQSDTFMDKLKKNKEVEYVERVPINRTSFTPNDLGANTNGGQWGLHRINAEAAWDITRGNNNIIVAVVDDAIMTTHPDLAGKIVNPRDVSDDDNDTNPPFTYFRHGTHVAGIAGAATNNETGVASIGYNVSVMPIKATHDTAPTACDGACVRIYDGYEGVTWAANNGADVINMSWGSSSFSTTNANVISAAAAQGVVLVASAGNSNSDEIRYPSGYPNVICVAATDINDDKASFSNFGTNVHVAAPGASIRSTVVSGGYQNWNGTSMASPMVAGLCGLILSADPSLTPAEVENCIESTAEPLDGTFDLGAGLINAQRAVECAAGSSATNSLSWNPTPTSISNGNNQVTLDYSINQNGILSVQVFNPSWELIGQVHENVSAGTRQSTLTLPAENPSATNNYLQAKLLDSNWGNIGVEQLNENVPSGGTPPPTGGNSLSWNPTPTSISNGNNQVTLDYSIDQSGILSVQVFNPSWELIGQVYENVSSGTRQSTLTLPAENPSATNNHLQAKLLDTNWGDIGVEQLNENVPSGGTPPPPPTGGNSLSWNPTPTSISNGNNQVTLDYSIDQSGILVVQVFNSSWDLVGQVYENVSSGTRQSTLTLSASGLSGSNNHLQAKLIDSDWGDIGVEQLYVSLP